MDVPHIKLNWKCKLDLQPLYNVMCQSCKIILPTISQTQMVYYLSTEIISGEDGFITCQAEMYLVVNN